MTHNAKRDEKIAKIETLLEELADLDFDVEVLRIRKTLDHEFPRWDWPPNHPFHLRRRWSPSERRYISLAREENL